MITRNIQRLVEWVHLVELQHLLPIENSHDDTVFWCFNNYCIRVNARRYTQHVESSSQGIFWSLQHTWNECEPSDRIPVITMATNSPHVIRSEMTTSRTASHSVHCNLKARNRQKRWKYGKGSLMRNTIIIIIIVILMMIIMIIITTIIVIWW